MANYQKCPKCDAATYMCDRFTEGAYYCVPELGGCGIKTHVKIEKINGLFCYTIPARLPILKKNITAFFHDFYIPVKAGGGEFPKMILNIKSNGTDAVKSDISKIIGNDLDKILETPKGDFDQQPIVIAVPRSKPDNFWQICELQFRPAISMGLGRSEYTVDGSNKKWMIDGTQYLIRTKATQTTHRAHLNDPKNIGDSPYSGITKDTCKLDGDIVGKNIILIDDIYTKEIGIDEDCIQFLLDNGAADVILYTLGMTIPPLKKQPDVPF